MRTVNTFGLQFLIRPDKLKDGKAPIYARITVNREIIHLGLKQYIEPRSWDIRRGSGKGTRDEVRALNNYLEDVRTEIGECYRELQLKKLPITAEAIKNTFLRTEEVEHTLNHLFAYHNKTAAHQLSPNTLSHYETSQKYLRSFIKEQHHKNDLHIKDVNYKFLTDFEVYLRSLKPKDHQKPIGNTGAMTHLIRFKKMINMAVNMEWISSSPFKSYKIKIRHEEREYLTKEELMKMEKKVFDLYRLEFVRDVFVFCSYTGLAYVDAMNLTQEQLTRGVDQELWIRTHRQKTKTRVNTPLLPKAAAIILKYQDDHRAVSNNKLFPVISNQKMNSYLKDSLPV